MHEYSTPANIKLKLKLRGLSKRFEPNQFKYTRLVDEYTFIFQYNHRLCRCTIHSDLGEFFDACKMEKFWLFLRPLSLAYLSSSSVENLCNTLDIELEKMHHPLDSPYLLEELRHPPNSPYLAASDYYLCRNLKKHPTDRDFRPLSIDRPIWAAQQQALCTLPPRLSTAYFMSAAVAVDSSHMTASSSASWSRFSSPSSFDDEYLSTMLFVVCR